LGFFEAALAAEVQAVKADGEQLDQLIRKAIAKKHLIRFRYQEKERIVEPHDYGIQKGITRLLSWQIGGQSSGRLPGWRWFDVSDMQDVEILDKSFPGNREVSGKHHQWDEIFIRVEPPEKS
jgi:predicted DNA-binding transcriptional regulator YafY